MVLQRATSEPGRCDDIFCGDGVVAALGKQLPGRADERRAGGASAVLLPSPLGHADCRKVLLTNSVTNVANAVG